MTPIIIHLDSARLELTSAESGVNFDLYPDDRSERLGWTRAGSKDAFLALDRNGNGTIDNGRELFGSAADQPPEGSRNGFKALAVFDANGDRVIDPADAIYPSLVLWTDRDHDGRSGVGELQSLRSAGVQSISLRYRESKRVDRHGNGFMFVSEAIIRNGRRTVVRQAWDIALTGPSAAPPRTEPQ